MVHRPDDAIVRGRNIKRQRFPLRDTVQNLAAISLDVTGEQSCFLAVFNEPAQRAAGLHDRWRQFVHVAVALIEHHNPC
jgi:hypothetical protein